MNERIQKLIEQATDLKYGHDRRFGRVFFDKEKFAELIIQECAKSLWTEECHNSDLALEEFERNSAKIKEHFGVEE
jgi:hypothetical protein